MQQLLSSLKTLAIVAVGVLALTKGAVAETKTDTINEARTYLYFQVPEATAQGLLPSGWVPAPVASGPAQGTNFILVLIDRRSAVDAEGKPLNAGVNRLAVLVVPTKNDQSGAAGPMVVGGYSADPAAAPGAYNVFVPANVRLERSEHGNQLDTEVEETWTFEAEGGERINLQLSYSRGVPALAPFEQNVYSGADPDFYRIYRGDQGVDVLQSTVTGVDRVDQFDFTASGGQLSEIFDGSEQLISVSSFPWYRRETFLP